MDVIRAMTGLVVWWIFVWFVTYMTGWGPGDPAFWGLIVISFPAGMITGWLAWRNKE